MNKSFKIMLVGKLPPPYMGPSVAFEILVNSDLNKHFDLCYLDTKANESLNTLGKWSFKKLLTNLKLYYKFYKKIKLTKPDLILIPLSQSTLGFVKDSIFILIANNLKCRTILQLRGSNFKNWYTGLPVILKKYIRSVLKKSVGVIVLGEKLKSIFSDFYAPDQIYVIPNGGNYTIPVKSGDKNGPVNIIYTGNLQSSKGIEDVILALIKLKESNPNKFYLNVIGNWRSEETKENCLDLIKKYDLPVKFHHGLFGNDKMIKISEGDIFVFTPRAPEGHPWVIIEALAAGLPVIATDQGAITESVLNKHNGYIVATRDHEQIASKLSVLINDQPLRLSMGMKSRQLYESTFTENIMIKNYIDTFNLILNNY